MEGAHRAQHGTTVTRPDGQSPRQSDSGWADALRYYHGKGAPPRAAEISAGFAVVLFVLLLLTALALLDQFA